MAKKPTKKAPAPRSEKRPPIIVIMGHIDHGKSTLLDYIRKTNIVESESGGITQHLSAYEVEHKREDGSIARITFLDTPGHEAFQKMRFHGAEVADIAILIVSAEDGVKAQTLEALSCIKKAKLPYIVAINKIDKPGADIERTKNSLLENEIYLEGLGGDIPYVPISAKQGTGILDLLDMMLLVADLEELTGDPSLPASGVVVESNLDPKKGISATLVIKNGTLESGMNIAAGDATAPVRILENFKGEKIKSATFSSPVRVVGFSSLPPTGAHFESFSTKKEAERAASEYTTVHEVLTQAEDESGKALIPIILKADVAGSLDAIEHEIKKLATEQVEARIIKKDVGAITESDIKTAQGGDGTLIIGFNTDIDPIAKDSAERGGIAIATFEIIYKLSEWLKEEMEKRRPAVESEEETGTAKILKIFNSAKRKHVIGARVLQGEISTKSKLRLLRRGEPVGEGVILNLQRGKEKTSLIREGEEFGAQVEVSADPAPGDEFVGFFVVKK